MRVLTVLVALIVTPLIVSVGQDRPESDHRVLQENHGVRHAYGYGRSGDVRRADDCENDEHADKDKNKKKHADKDKVKHADDDQCSTQQPPPPPPPPPQPTASGEIHGTVWLDANGDGLRDPTEVGIANWFVMLVGSTVPAVQTDGAGNYAFTGLSAGTYTVCAQQRSFYIETAPAGTTCSGLGGYTVVITSQVVTGQDFGIFN